MPSARLVRKRITNRARSFHEQFRHGTAQPLLHHAAIDEAGDGAGSDHPEDVKAVFPKGYKTSDRKH